jgi:hypothetical protein
LSNISTKPATASAVVPTDKSTALMLYDAACRAIAEARSIDEAKDIRDKAVAMAAYAKQAKNRGLEADAVEIRMRATRRLDQMRQEQAATVGLAKGGGGKHGRKRVAEKPTLKDAGIDKNLAHEGRKLGALSEQEFEQKVAEVRDAVTSATAKVVKSITLPKERAASEAEIEITLAQWKAMTAAEKAFHLQPENFPSDVKFNTQDSDGIDWAQKSYSTIVGCKHPCKVFCWANDTTLRFPHRYPHGFNPVFRPRMLNAPRNTPVPPEAAFDGRYKNVFSNSMSDMFGGWIPPEWIEATLAVERADPRWNFLHLTKFPQRLIKFDLPPNVWIGTTVDWQVRVPNAEDAFAKLREKYPNAIFFLSIEPMFEPLKFTRLDLFRWVIIGGAAKSMRTPEWRPPHRWIMDLIAQADAEGCKVFEKTNLLGNRILELPFDAPIKSDYPQIAPDVFHYLGRERHKLDVAQEKSNGCI